MVTIYMKNDILSLKRDGMSNRKIALKLNISKDTVNKYVKEKELSLSEVLQGFLELCKTIEKLHEKGLSHRDIKPGNLYFYNNRFYIGDFGLVAIPNIPKRNTKSNRRLGAIFTMAPEMLRNPKCADGKKADIYSMSKTLWMLITNDEYGFDGQYNTNDNTHSLKEMSKFKGEYIIELEEVLTLSTDNDPKKRPTISKFIELLSKQLEISKSSDLKALEEWNYLNNKILNANEADEVTWRNIDEIIKILNIIGGSKTFNHMLFPNKGGLDLKLAKKAAEEGCIYLKTDIGNITIIKPSKLTMYKNKKSAIWNFFWLELEELSPIDKMFGDSFYEVLVEDYPGHYIHNKDRKSVV